MSSSRGWPARYPVLQPPNTTMLVAQGFRAVVAVTDGRARASARVGYHATLAVWAYDELAHGENAVRRALGAVTLGYVAQRAGAELGRR
jgi:hypothetical protein